MAVQGLYRGRWHIVAPPQQAAHLVLHCHGNGIRKKLLMDSFLKAQHRQHYNRMRLYFRISLTHRGSPSTFVAIPRDSYTPFPYCLLYANATLSVLLSGAAQGKSEVHHTPLAYRRVLMPLSKALNPRWRTTKVCDAWPVRRQTYGYLPSHKTSPPNCW